MILKGRCLADFSGFMPCVGGGKKNTVPEANDLKFQS